MPTAPSFRMEFQVFNEYCLFFSLDRFFTIYNEIKTTRRPATQSAKKKDRTQLLFEVGMTVRSVIRHQFGLLLVCLI